jgi:hypothetical protein
MKVSVVIAPTLFHVHRLSLGIIFILCVPENEMGNLQLLRKLACLTYRAVVLFVRFKPVPLTVQAKRFTQKPLASFHKAAAQRIIGFIS